MVIFAAAMSVLSSQAQSEDAESGQVQSGEAESGDAESSAGDRLRGKRLFERETFGGNGRTCSTCHSPETGTVSPEDAEQRFADDPRDPLFVHDGSDDGKGNGVTRMLADATVLVEVALHPNVRLADDPTARTVTLRRGIPSTLNTPALDPVLMQDGRDPDLQAQARGAISGHAQSTEGPSEADLQLIAEFQQTRSFFSSRELRRFARDGSVPELPQGHTESEKRGRLFFEDVPVAGLTQKAGSCAVCHSGPMLNETNKFSRRRCRPARASKPFSSPSLTPPTTRRGFHLHQPGRQRDRRQKPRPGTSLGDGKRADSFLRSLNAFKIPSLWGAAARPLLPRNSAKTLEDVRHTTRASSRCLHPAGGGARRWC